MTRKKARLAKAIAVSAVVFLYFKPLLWAADVEAKRAEELMIVEKQIEEEKEKAMITHFYEEGMRLLEDGDYEGATEQFSRVLEIDPNHTKAKRGIKKVRKMLSEEKKLRSPEAMAKKLLIRGRVKYGRNDFEGAIEDFQNALILDYKNEDILEWLKRARRRKNLEEAKRQQEDIISC